MISDLTTRLGASPVFDFGPVAAGVAVLGVLGTGPAMSYYAVVGINDSAAVLYVNGVSSQKPWVPLTIVDLGPGLGCLISFLDGNSFKTAESLADVLNDFGLTSANYKAFADPYGARGGILYILKEPNIGGAPVCIAEYFGIPGQTPTVVVVGRLAFGGKSGAYLFDLTPEDVGNIIDAP